NKGLLYRHERDRVISIRFWRVAAAAAILFACLFTVISLLKKDRAEEAIAKKMIKPSTDKQIINNSEATQNVVDPSQTNAPENIASVKEKDQNSNTTVSTDIEINTTGDKKQITSNDKLAKEE